MENHTPAERAARMPTIHIISDSVGVTAQAVARAAAAQFGVMDPKIEILPKVKSFEEIKRFLDEHVAYHVDTLGDDRLLVFYTLVHSEMREKLRDYIAQRENIEGVDIMGSAIDSIASLSGLQPTSKPGTLRTADASYFRRIEAVEFTIEHDDGRNPQDLTKADMVILGVSRSSKTPLSIFLAQQGLKVANIPLDPTTEVPKEIYDVDPTRIFGLMTTPEVLSDIRIRRLGNARGVAAEYADIEYIYQDLESARALMRRLGCIVVHTEKKAVEETAQEILRYYERSHPSPTGIIE
ncbi:MAG: kinase/pyrophosphorylase [Eggerthellaceae bacterium]|nr:kinase/pyrophosphorylase [Eggerthellaceae bacterium]